MAGGCNPHPCQSESRQQRGDLSIFAGPGLRIAAVVVIAIMTIVIRRKEIKIVMAGISYKYN